AHLHLWDTYNALARKARNEAEVSGKLAAGAFAKLGWKHQEVETRALIGRRPRQSRHFGTTIAPPGEFLYALTERQRQVASLVFAGMTNRDIAETLSITEHTVESHMTSILRCLGLRSRWQLVQGASLMDRVKA